MLSVCFYTDQYCFMTMKRMCEKRYFGQTLTKYKMKISLVSGSPPFQHRLVQTENWISVNWLLPSLPPAALCRPVPPAAASLWFFTVSYLHKIPGIDPNWLHRGQITYSLHIFILITTYIHECLIVFTTSPVISALCGQLSSSSPNLVTSPWPLYSWYNL